MEASLSAGLEVVSVSIHVQCRLSHQTFVGKSRVQQVPVIVRLREGPAPDSGIVSLFDFSLARDADTLYLHEECTSAWFIHVPSRPSTGRRSKNPVLGLAHWVLVRTSCGCPK